MASELSGTMPADVPDGAVSVPDGAAEQRPDTSGVLQQVGLSPEQDQHRPSSGGPRQSDAQLPPADPPSPQRPHSPNPDPTPALQQQCPSPSTPPQKQQQQLQPDPTPGPIQVIADVHGTGPDAFAAPSDFMMYVFKVLPCPHGNSHAWAQCPFLHPGEHARRRDPRVYPYSPVACPDMKRFNACPKGDACSSSHGDFEYWLHPHRYRTQLCRDGAACQRRVCFFAHDPRDLRPPTTVLGPTAQLPLVPGAMPRLIGPAAVSGMGAPGSGVVVVVGRAGGSKGGPAGSPAKRGGPGPAAADLPESAGLFTVSAAPPAAVEPPAVPDGPAATTTTSSSSSSPRGGTSAAGAAAVGEQVAALQLGSSSPSKAAGQNGEGGMLAADAPAAGPVQGDPGESSEADGAAGADGAVSSPMAAAAAPSGAEGAAVPSVGSPAAAAPAAPGGGQQTRVAVEVLDASGKPVFIHPDNVKLLDVLLREVPPEEGRRNLPRPSGAPLLRFTPPAMPEAMAAGNRGHNPASRYPGPAGTMPVADSRPGNRRGNPQGGGPFPLGGYGRGPHAGHQARPYGGALPQGGMGGLPLGAGLGHGGGGGGGAPYQAGRMAHGAQQQSQHQVLLAHGATPMYHHQQQQPPGLAEAMLQPHRPPQQQQQLGGYGGAMDGYGAAPAIAWAMPGAQGAGWDGAAAAGAGLGTAAGMQPNGAPPLQQPLQGGAQGVMAAGRQYPGHYPGQQQQQHQPQQSYMVVQDAQSSNQQYWLQPSQQQQQQHMVYASHLQPQPQQQQQQQSYYVMQSGDGMQLQAGAGGAASAAMLVSASHPYAASSSAMGLGLVLGAGAGGMGPQGAAQQQQQQPQQQQQGVDRQGLYGAAAHNPLLQGMQYVMLPGSQPGGLEHMQPAAQQMPW